MDDSFERDKQQRMDRFRERFWEDNPYALSLLKGHLLVEEVLEEIIVSACKNPSAAYDARMSFYSKTKLAEAISGDDSAAWRCVERLNSARNELAHGRDDASLEEKIDALIRTTRTSYPQATWYEERVANLELAVIVVHAALSRVAMDRLRS